MPNLTMFQPTLAGSESNALEASRVALDLAGHLLSDTAHDLRSPLAAARELTQLVADGIEGPVSPEQREHLEAVVARCNDMQRLIDDMLQFECARTGTPKLFRIWLRACELPAMVQPLVESKLSRREIELQWIGFEEELPAMFADTDKIKRLLVNLIDNAIRVTPDAGQINIRTELARTNDRIRLTVEDAGPGLTAEQLKELGNRGVSHQGGNGLGLTICRQIAALHCTHVTVESEHGRGTRFGLELPVGGLSSVVGSFAMWREMVLPASPVKPSLRPSSSLRRRPIRRIESGPAIQNLPGVSNPPQHTHTVAMVAVNTIETDESTSQASMMQLDRFLQGFCGLHELAYRIERDQWIMLWDASIAEAQKRIELIDQMRLNHSDPEVVHQKLQWSSPIIQSVGANSDRAKLERVFTRVDGGERDDSTSALTMEPPSYVANGRDDDSPSDQRSEVAQRRLESEVQWITQRFRDRHQQLSKHSQSLRPRS
ncbi:MAG: HAMP domain-containing sensor histidine kinase [Pirellulaceae bacterium]